MPMNLQGSCQCGLVEFTLESHTPAPYQICACSICRKCGGYGGTVNLGGIASTLQITKGKEYIKKYNAIADRGKPTEKKCISERNFCSECASMLWLWDKTWPELIHPFASAIDTELPVVEEMVCVKGDSKPEYVRWPEGKKKVYEGYGDFSIEEWHKKNGLFVE
ncbi:69704f58-3d86-432e-a04b-dbbf46f1ec84-CDS [Sclerotinia trifoliorum]|uniref:69704f58-3d86-432e-a04b-dbbf46f1ec84-CDS n=1 Tax=Sclerotinia trifoliorum TaxID=28548 RepID=A0A8H2VYZ6_9HELO|nr:69704f58-3d86-432e-a04b-dbbf46f1ec84-CDS [Sclerotinia trifoliorum]